MNLVNVSEPFTIADFPQPVWLSFAAAEIFAGCLRRSLLIMKSPAHILDCRKYFWKNSSQSP